MDNNLNDLCKNMDNKKLINFLIQPKKKTRQLKECDISNLAKLNNIDNNNENNIKPNKINLEKYIECYSNE